VLILANVLFGVALAGRVYEHVVVDPISRPSLLVDFAVIQGSRFSVELRSTNGLAQDDFWVALPSALIVVRVLAPVLNERAPRSRKLILVVHWGYLLVRKGTVLHYCTTSCWSLWPSK
jgi:hypothetical protein